MNSQSVRWALWSGAAVAGIAALAVGVFFTVRTHPQSNDAVMQQIEDSVRPAATQMTNLQHRLVIYDMTLAMRVERGALSSAEVQAALLQRAQELESRDLGDAQLVVEQAQEAASYFQFIDSRIAASSAWPTDKPAATYRAIAQRKMKLARQNFDMALQRGLPPSLALDEASAALALSNGTVVGVAQSTAFDRAHDEIVALVRDYALGKVQPPTSHVADNIGADAGSSGALNAPTVSASAPSAVNGGSSHPPNSAAPGVGNSVPAPHRPSQTSGGSGGEWSVATCERWNISGRWQINQGDGPKPVFDLRQNGNHLKGRATWNGVVAPVNGSLTNSTFDVLVTWSNDSKGRYRGTVSQGAINGEDYDEIHPESRASWAGTGPTHCVP